MVMVQIDCHFPETLSCFYTTTNQLQLLLDHWYLAVDTQVVHTCHKPWSSNYCQVTHAHSDCLLHLSEMRVAKLILRPFTNLNVWKVVLGLGISSDWKYRITEYWGRHFYLHWIYNKIIRELKWDQGNRNIDSCNFKVSRFDSSLYL